MCIENSSPTVKQASNIFRFYNLLFGIFNSTLEGIDDIILISVVGCSELNVTC